MCPWYRSDGVCLVLAVLLVVVPFPGWGQPQEGGCGRCWIESYPEERCNITSIDWVEIFHASCGECGWSELPNHEANMLRDILTPFGGEAKHNEKDHVNWSTISVPVGGNRDYNDKTSQLPRSYCHITEPKLKVKLVPVTPGGCKIPTFNVSIKFPDEGIDCLTGFRLSIAHHASHDWLFAYDIKLSNGNWSRFGKDTVLQFRIPNPETTTCAPQPISEGKYFFKVQPVPAKKIPMRRSISEDVFDYFTVYVPTWAPDKWTTIVNHEVLTDGVRAWFDVPPEPLCFCLRKFKFMLVSEETKLSVGDITVSYPENKGFFSKLEEETYKICVRALECGEGESCQLSCTDWFTYPKAPTDWFTYPEAPTTPLTIATTSNGSTVIPTIIESPPSWVRPTIGIAVGAIAVLLLVGGVVAYTRVQRPSALPDADTKPSVAVLYHGSSNRIALQHLKSLLEMGNRFVCRQINLKNPFLTRFFRKYPDDVINMSAIILIVCSKETADDFLETRSWPSDAVHRKVLSLICVESNRRKQVLVKLNPGWNKNNASHLLDWIRFPGGTISLTGDSNGSEFLNAINDVIGQSPYEWASMSTLPPDALEMGPSSGRHHFGEMMVAGRSALSDSDPLLSEIRT